MATWSDHQPAAPRLSPREKAIRQRLKDDFEHYAPRCLKIRTKSGQIRPFILNTAQRHIHEACEDQRRRTGKVRILVVKGRQQGARVHQPSGGGQEPGLNQFTHRSRRAAFAPLAGNTRSSA